jgi:hypothetical protein
MTRITLAIAFSLACASPCASAADLPNRRCAPAVTLPQVCAGDPSGVPLPQSVIGSSIPANRVLDTAAESDLAACRPIADQARAAYRTQVLANCVRGRQVRRHIVGGVGL